jgi:hypothetical protein
MKLAKKWERSNKPRTERSHFHTRAVDGTTTAAAPMAMAHGVSNHYTIGERGRRARATTTNGWLVAKQD